MDDARDRALNSTPQDGGVSMNVAILASWALLAAAPATAQPGPPPKVCVKPEHRQCDFWAGRWDVFVSGSNRLVGHSQVEKLYDGCVLRENWTGVGGGAGGSLNLYQAVTGRWRQTWADSTGGMTEYSGQLVGSDMRFLAAETDLRTGAFLVRRMTFSPLPDGTVRQLIEVSPDSGTSWKVEEDLNYRRAAAAPAGS